MYKLSGMMWTQEFNIAGAITYIYKITYLFIEIIIEIVK